jgi:periplasmic divalent cation tolerance protein
MSKFIQVSTTTDTKEEAEKISDLLITNKIAACIQILGPIKSIYWWNGKIERADEWLCLIKSKKSNYKKVEKIILENHSYETPELVAIPIQNASPAYSKWLSDVII